MSLFNASPYLSQLLADNSWAEPPTEFVTREGKLARLIGGKWHLPVQSCKGLVDINKYGSALLRWAVTKYMVQLAQTVSAIEALNSVKSIFSELNHRDFFQLSTTCIHPEILRPALIEQMERMICKLKAERKLWRAYRPVQWYIWGAEHYPELGFCIIYAQELDEMSIPGNPKGEAVRSQDAEQGALHPHLEISLIAQALKDDTSEDFEHYQQRAAIALAKSYGRNPANFIAMREEDYFDIAEDPEEPEYMLQLPRIKKGFVSARSDFIVEAMEEQTQRHVSALIEKNQAFDSLIEVNGAQLACARPLFRHRSPNGYNVQLGDYESAYHMYSAEFTKLLSDFSKRMGLISPLTEMPMHLTARRFRYTVGTVYAAMGMSRKELAYRLDHTDTQHVQVYFDVLANLTYAIDKAAILKYSRKVNLYKGSEVIDPEAAGIIASDKLVQCDDYYRPGHIDALGGCGLNELCHKFPPFSCYLCPKFRPFKSEVHEHILEMLIRMHNERPESQTVGVHRMEVILAVGQVVRMCQASIH